MHRLKLTPPKIEHLGTVLRNESPCRIGVEGKLFPILEQPLARNLDQAVLMKIGDIVTHRTGAVLNAMAGEKCWGPRIDLKPGSTKTNGATSYMLFKEFDAATENLFLLGFAKVGQLLMKIAMETNFVTAGYNRINHSRVMLDDISRNEERRRNLQMIK